jgi:hypothetical protein
VTGPFAEAAHDLRRRGLAVIPCPSGKSPRGAYRFETWKHPPGRTFVDHMIRNHGRANIGIVTSLSRRKLTVVDVDDSSERVQLAALDRCGTTPLVTMTPSRGLHLWYRYNGEASANLRQSDGIPVEVKTAASRLVVVVPPSVGKPGRSYMLVQGTWDDLDNLPTVKPGALRRLDEPAQPKPVERVQEGCRNDTLWRYCMCQARHCDDLVALVDVARTFAEDQLDLTGRTHSISDAEISRAARSAWRYEIEGRNLFGRGGAVILGHCEIDALIRSPDAFLLYVALARQHARGSEFPLAKSRAGAFGWGANRLKSARDVLEGKGIITCVSPGGRGPNDPPRYRWSQGV